MRLSSLLFVPLIVAVSSVYADDIQHPGLMSVLARANGLLSAGKYADAARAYSEAIELSPSDYMIFYRRATAHMSLQRHPQALSDFQRVLQLTNSPPATTHLQIARLLAKNGDFVGARAAVKTYNTSANSELGRRETQDVLFKVSEAEGAWKTAEANRKAGLWTACVESATVALTTASHASEIRGIRAECGISGGDIELGVSDLARLAQIAQPSTALFMRIFRISYLFLPPSPSSPQTGPMAALKSCLHYDPDSKPCKQAHRLVKALDKVFVKLDSALSAEQTGNVIALAGGPEGLLAKLDAFSAEHGGQDQLRFPAFAPQGKLKMPLPEAQKSSPRFAHVLGALCRAHTRVSTGKRLQDAANLYANRLLNMDLSAPQMESVGAAAEVDALVLKGEAAMAREDWEEAARVLGDAFEKSGRDRDVYSRFSKAQRLLKQSKQKDYYKVLGVSRDADARTIKKAFRTAAKTAHPDKGGSEAKMAAVNEAYEVLSNPELRARFDNGDDPNDPAGAQGGPGGGGFGGFQFQQGGFGGGGGFPGGHPFAQFFSGQGGGGGAQFHFRTG